MLISSNANISVTCTAAPSSVTTIILAIYSTRYQRYAVRRRGARARARIRSLTRVRLTIARLARTRAPPRLQPPASERRGVAFFFHEHVTAILKRSEGSSDGRGGGFDFIDSLPHSPAGVGVRIWCADIEVLRQCLLWYTTSKFTPSNHSFIDSTPWDDANCEFDPRVFQAYVWRTAPA